MDVDNILKSIESIPEPTKEQLEKLAVILEASIPTITVTTQMY